MHDLEEGYYKLVFGDDAENADVVKVRKTKEYHVYLTADNTYGIKNLPENAKLVPVRVTTDLLNAKEHILAFYGWLSGRDVKIILGSKQENEDDFVKLINYYCSCNQMEDITKPLLEKFNDEFAKIRGKDSNLMSEMISAIGKNRLLAFSGKEDVDVIDEIFSQHITSSINVFIKMMNSMAKYEGK